MKYFLNSIITFLIITIMLFGWSISKNFTPNNISNQIEIKSEDPKIKLFENEKSRTLRVAVLNGCGERGIGDQFSSFLNNSYGLIITRTENAKDGDGENKFDYENTKVIIINENNTNIENMLTILGMKISDSNIEFNSTIDFDEDIQIIVGKDYADFINLNK
jgi:hypothetical protein